MTTPPPGWYPDPESDPTGPASLRWWDGSWSEHTRPAELAPPAAAVPQVPAYAQPAPALVPPVAAPSAPAQPAAPAFQQAAPSFQPAVPSPDSYNYPPQPTYPVAPPQVQTATPAPAPEPLPRAYNQWDPNEDRKRNRNTFANTALILGIFALVVPFFAPWIVAVDGVGAIVFGILGIRRSRYVDRGKAKSVWGIVLGSIGLVAVLITAVLAGVAATVGDATTSGAGAPVVPTLENTILVEYNKQLVDQGVTQTVVGVACPDTVDDTVGAKFLCVATSDAGVTQNIEVTVANENGDITWATVQ